MFSKNLDRGAAPQEASCAERGSGNPAAPKNKRGVRSFALNLLAALALLLIPSAPARAQSSASVIASAIIVPAQVSELGFLQTAILREVAVKEGDAVTAGQRLAALDATEQEYAVKAALAAYRSAQSYADLQHHRVVKTRNKRGKVIYTYLPREAILRADSLAEAARASFEAAQAQLEEFTLRAPYDAVVAAVHAAPGELVSPDRPVLTIAALNQMQIETTDLSERDIAKIKIGQKATVFVEALGKEFSARVTAIAPRAQTVGGDVVFKVTLAFEKQPDGLLWGMTAEVTIRTE